MARPRKTGKRTPKGRLSRSLVETRVPGNDRAERAKVAFGGNGTDAIGRAYERGLLGCMNTQGQEAKAMLDTARSICRAYWQAYEVGPIRCTFADRNSGGGRDDGFKARETWLNAMLDIANRGGSPCRVLFDALVIDINPDEGPLWLDRIIDNPKAVSANDWGCLGSALYTLAECAGVTRLTARRA